MAVAAAIITATTLQSKKRRREAAIAVDVAGPPSSSSWLPAFSCWAGVCGRGRDADTTGEQAISSWARHERWTEASSARVGSCGAGRGRACGHDDYAAASRCGGRR
ncbi:hypothetical protein ZWY2020_047161 [Hordeum vulgare]|nr:hypothetical protein ZWY2020_047161 [Hordeum vulgare]